MRAILMALVFVTLPLAGCTAFNDLVEGINRPDIPVARSDVESGQLTTQDRFQVVVQQVPGHEVRIEARETTTGDELVEEGVSDAEHPVVLQLRDGTWDITYFVAGHKWESIKGLRIDATPPQASGFQTRGSAEGGSFTIGGQAVVEEGAAIRVVDLQTGRLLATSLPHTVSGLTGDRVYSFLVALGDEAGNWNNVTVQVRTGSAAALPERGDHSFGVLARFTNEVQLWDITDLDAYVSPATARAAAPGLLGDGSGVTPDDPVIQGIVDQALDGSEDTTAEVAWSLYLWMFNELEYDDRRLSESDLLDPRETVENGGGVCRDLAALYVSLLRAAGVPARLVSGYLAGEVNGFHAWVEFYGGALGDQPAWIPVDVSPIDGPFEAQKALSAFGIQRPDYLTLRKVPSPEPEGWSTALSVRYSYYGAEPDITFEKTVTPVGQDQVGVLCVDDDTRARQAAAHQDDCASSFDKYVPGFVRFTERRIDYGILLREAQADTEVTAEVAYPFFDDVRPNSVDHIVYADDAVGGWNVDAARGVVHAKFTV